MRHSATGGILPLPSSPWKESNPGQNLATKEQTCHCPPMVVQRAGGRIVWRVSQGTAHLPASRRCRMMASVSVLGFDTPSDFGRAYPTSRVRLTLLIRRMDAVYP